MNNFVSALDSNQSPGIGLAAVSLLNNSLFWNISWSGLEDVNAVHFVDLNGSLQINAGTQSNQEIPYESPLVGKGPLLLGSMNQTQQLLDGNFSINIITDQSPNAEISGKVTPIVSRMIFHKPLKPSHSHRGNRRKSTTPIGQTNHVMDRMIRSNQSQRKARMNMSTYHRRDRDQCEDCGEYHNDE